MKRFSIFCFLVLVWLPALFALAREVTPWQAVPAAPQVDESRPASRATFATRASVYDASDIRGPSVTWGNANIVPRGESNASSSIQLASNVVPTQLLDDDDFSEFNSSDVMLPSGVPPQRLTANVSPAISTPLQQPTLFQSWEQEDISGGLPYTPRATPTMPTQAIPVAADVHRNVSPIEVAPVVVRIPDVPVVDMQQNPKYSRFLPNTMPCGVVLIQADFPLREVESVFNEIALLQEDLLHYLAVPAPREKIDLCLFSSSRAYVKFLESVFPNAPTDRPALFIKRPGEPATLLVQHNANFEVDLRHEMTHAILHARIDNVPMWLDEGLSKYLELPRQQRPYNSPYLKTVKWQSNLWMTSSLTRLESLKFVDEMGSREYRDSWAWIHFLIHHSPETHQFLASYLQRLTAASDRERAGQRDKIAQPPMSRLLAQEIDNPKSAMRAHFSRWPLPTTSHANNSVSPEGSGSLTAFFSKRERQSENSAPARVVTSEDAPKKWYQLW